MFTDTHCHIHAHDYPLDADATIKRAFDNGVKRMICVGTDEDDSTNAFNFVQDRDGVWATVGLHPHDAKNGLQAINKLRELLKKDQASEKRRIVGIGECGLDYFYDNSPREAQFDMIHAQLELARDFNLPMTLHVREAFDNFWPIFDQYSGIRGVLHSFTDNITNRDKGLERGLYIGVNGISTFTKDEAQKQMYATIPRNRLLFETDAPFLTPTPFRGKVNEPAFIKNVAENMAQLQGSTIDEIARVTENNASKLFSLN